MTDLDLSSEARTFSPRHLDRSESAFKGIQGGARAYLLSLAADESRRPMLVIAPSAKRGGKSLRRSGIFPRRRALLAAVSQAAPSLSVLGSTAFRKSLAPSGKCRRPVLEGLYKLVEEHGAHLIATPAALMQRVIPKEAVQTILSLSRRRARSGARVVARIIWSTGVFKMSRWSRSAAILACAAASSIFSRLAMARPLRLEFDGDRLESIREFSPANQRTEAAPGRMLLLPMKEFSLKAGRLRRRCTASSTNALWSWKSTGARSTGLLESMREGIPFRRHRIFGSVFLS